VPKQYPEDLEIEITFDDEEEEVSDKLTMMDDDELMEFGFWLDDLNAAYEEEASLRFGGRTTGH
jgi:hypothetical protein